MQQCCLYLLYFFLATPWIVTGCNDNPGSPRVSCSTSRPNNRSTTRLRFLLDNSIHRHEHGTIFSTFPVAASTCYSRPPSLNPPILYDHAAYLHNSMNTLMFTRFCQHHASRWRRRWQVGGVCIVSGLEFSSDIWSWCLSLSS